jgi:predicted metal-dependent hydrolase
LSALPAPIDLVPGAAVPIRGFSHQILHAKDKRGVAWLSPGDPSDGIDPQLVVTGEVEHANRRVKDFLKRLARSDLDSAVAHYSSQLNLRKPNVFLRDTSSRWGSC